MFYWNEDMSRHDKETRAAGLRLGRYQGAMSAYGKVLELLDHPDFADVAYRAGIRAAVYKLRNAEQDRWEE